MPVPADKSRVVRFGVFEVDLQDAELRKSGIRIKLQEQPFRILTMLLERPGQAVTREEIERELWADRFVDFDHSLNSCINKLREALGDDSENPRFIETLPRRGYRFIARVDFPGSPVAGLGFQVPSTALAPAGVATHTSQISSSIVIAAAKQHAFGVAAGTFAMLTVLGVASFGLYSLLHRVNATPFQKFTIEQITHSGKVAQAAIAPDGKYVLSVIDDNGTESLWLRNVHTGSDTQVIPPSASDYESLAFSPDGNYLYFRRAPNQGSAQLSLYRSPVLGGAPQKLVQNIDSDIAFSPDGQRIAFFRRDDPEVGKYRIFTASSEGNDEKVVQVGVLSDFPRFLAWSPRGDEIAYSVYTAEPVLGAIDIINVRTGKSHRFGTFKEKFPFEIHWSPDGRALLVVYRRRGGSWGRGQIGFLRSTGGDIEPMTRDTNRYTNLTLSADGKSLATVLARSDATVYLLSKTGREFAEPRPLLSQSNEFDDWSALSWGADGSLLVSNTGRLLKLGTDGKNQTQLLADSGALIVTPSSCGKDYLVLSWVGHGSTNSQSIWRTNADGSNPLKLTDGKDDIFPVCSPDRKWVYYSHWVDGHISRVPLDDSGKAEAVPGVPQEYISQLSLSISHDGKTLAAAVSKAPEVDAQQVAVKIALFNLKSWSPARMLDASHYCGDACGTGGGVQFTADQNAVAYVIRENGVDNVWVKPLDGSSGHAITDFKSEQIWSFSLSPDGKSLAVLRGHWDSDVVLLQETRR